MKLELVNIEREIKQCFLCEGIQKSKFDSISFGTNEDLLFIGESPSKNSWMVTGKAFVNKSGNIVPTGKVLAKLLKILNMNLEDIIFTEAVKCYVPDRKILKKCSNNCKNILNTQILNLNPKIIIPLGEYPTRVLLKNTVEFKNFREVVGTVHNIKIKDRNFIVFPIYHPSPISPAGYRENIPIFNKLKKICNL